MPSARLPGAPPKFPIFSMPSCTVVYGAVITVQSGPSTGEQGEGRDTSSTLRKEPDRLQRIFHRVPRRWLPPCPSW